MHYICEGSCHGVADHSKTCEDKACPNYNVTLTPCDCTDGKHYGKQDNLESNQ